MLNFDKRGDPNSFSTIIYAEINDNKNVFTHKNYSNNRADTRILFIHLKHLFNIRYEILFGSDNEHVRKQHLF